MLIRAATLADAAMWATLRTQLWSGTTYFNNWAEALLILEEADDERAIFVVIDEQDRVCGFVEASLLYKQVKGGSAPPVAYIDGLYVQEVRRREGLGAYLMIAIQTWARERGCTEISSDGAFGDVRSEMFHAALGFEQTERVVHYRKKL